MNIRSCFSFFLIVLFSISAFSQTSLSLIREAYEQQNYALAHEAIEQYVSAKGKKAGADAWILKGDIKQAYAFELLSKNGSEARILIRKAHKSYQRALKLGQAEASETAFQMADYEQRITAIYQRLVSEAKGFYLENKLDRTIETATWAIDLKPEDSLAYQLAYNTAFEIRDYPRALRLAENGLLHFPETNSFRKAQREVLSAMVNKRAGEQEWEEVANYLLKLQELDPDNGDYHFNLGLAYDRMGEWELAIRELVRAIKAKPDDYISYYYMAKIHVGKAQGSSSPQEQKMFMEKASLYLQIGHQIHPQQPAINSLMEEVNRYFSKK